MTRASSLIIAAAVVLLARPALAGPPLLCFPFEIGTAKSLPMGHGGWQQTDPKYDVSHLVADTLALLTPETPIMVRMETMRRATIYASTNPAVAEALLKAFEDRAKVSREGAGLQVFDFGYLVETYKEAKPVFKMAIAGIERIDGYQLVLKARALQGDPAMDLAAKQIAMGYPKNATR
jgi:hypothetical protein